MKCTLDLLNMEIKTRNMFGIKNIYRKRNNFIYEMQLPIHEENRYWLNLFDNVKVMREVDDTNYKWIKITL